MKNNDQYRLQRLFNELSKVPVKDQYKRAAVMYSVYLASQVKIEDNLFIDFLAVIDSRIFFLAEEKIRKILLGKESEIPSKNDFKTLLPLFHLLVDNIRNALLSDIKMNGKMLREGEARKIFSIFKNLIKDLKSSYDCEVHINS